MTPIRFSKLDHEERWEVYGASRASLVHGRNGAPGRDYLLWERGLDEGTIADFRLGYVPLTVDHPFAGRIVMPIFDAYSGLLALSLRPIFKVLRLKDREVVAIDPKSDGQSYSYVDEYGSMKSIPYGEVMDVGDPDPKYWNESFSKGEHLYGMQLAKYEIVRKGFAILVEGQFDVMAMHAYGFKNTVGICGGAFTPIHAMLMRRWTRQVVLLFDGDRAGQGHAMKAKEILDAYCVRRQVQKEIKKKWQVPPQAGPLAVHMKYAIANLPDKHDPDSYLMQHGSYLMKRLVYDAMAQNSMTIPKEAA